MRLVLNFKAPSTPATSQRCRSNIVECYTSRTILSTKSNVASTSLPFLATMSNEISPFRQNRNNELNTINLFRLCRKDVISRKTRSTLLPKTATTSKQHTTLYHSSMLLRYCCWCGRNFRRVHCGRTWTQSTAVKSKCSDVVLR